MPKFKVNALNILCLLLLTVISAAFQCTFWFQIFESLPAPWIWLNVFLYIILFRKANEAIWILYGFCLFLVPFTSMRIAVLWLLTCITYYVVTFVKKRIYWPGVRYFFYASLGINFLFQITYLIYSKISEPNPVSILFFHRLAEVLLSSLFSIPIYWLCNRIDHWTEKEFLPEAGEAKT